MSILIRKRRSLSKNGLTQFSQGELKKPVRLSFVIPAYNEEACLGKCLDSIMAETRHFPGQTEVIVVDNASSDRTWVVASSYPGVHIVYEPRKGIVWARQAGYTAAGGDLIANIDADNMLTKGWLTKVLKEFSRNNKLVALSGPLVYHDVSWVRKVQTKLFYGLAYPTYLINHFLIRKGGMVREGTLFFGDPHSTTSVVTIQPLISMERIRILPGGCSRKDG